VPTTFREKQVTAWADKNKVEVTADFITTTGSKSQLTPAAETQANAGHDVMTFITWDTQNHADHLQPVDDQMKRLARCSRPTSPATVTICRPTPN
jgi:hypothetical protein